MIGTLIAFLLGVYLYFFPTQYTYDFDPSFASAAMLAAASGALLGILLIFVSAYFPLLQAEKKLTPRLLDIFISDRRIRLYTAWLIGFAIISYILTMLDLSKRVLDPKLIFSVWIILLGVSIDFTYQLTHRVLTYLNPFDVITMLSNKAQEDIRNNEETGLLHCLDGLTEIALKSVSLQSTSLSSQAAAEMDKVIKVFLESSKSIAHHDPEEDTKGLGANNKTSYTLFYLFQRMEMLFNKASDSRNEPLCNHIIQVMGKMVIHAAKYDITLAGDPLLYINKFVHKAMKEGMANVGDMTSCTLQEVARILMDEIDLTYLEIKDVYVSLINCLDEIAKETFKHNKTISIPFLMLPFQKLQKLFETEKMQSHQDTIVIIQNIKRVLMEFETLKTVMESMPAMPAANETKEQHSS